MLNWDRTYRFAAGQGGGKAFEVGHTGAEVPMPLRASFSFEKTDLETANIGKISIWNLSPDHIAELERTNCIASLRAGYGNRMPLLFSGLVVNVKTEEDGADRCTSIEVEDSLVNIRDSYISISYTGKCNCKKILDDVAGQMGVAIQYSYNAEFVDIPNGYSYAGQARNVLTKICKTSNLAWSLQNGILQVKKPGDVMEPTAYSLSASSGLVNFPRRFSSTATDDSKKDNHGWEVDYLMNCSIGIDDYVELQSERVNGFFRVQSVKIEGDTHGERWICTAKLVSI